MITEHLADCYVKRDPDGKPLTLHILPAGGDWVVIDLTQPVDLGPLQPFLASLPT